MTTTRLTAEEQYQRDGYVVPAFKLSDEWMERLRAALTHVEQAHPEVGLDFVESARTGLRARADGVRGFAFAGIPEVLDEVWATDWVGLLMWGSALFGKPGRDGSFYGTRTASTGPSNHSEVLLSGSAR